MEWISVKDKMPKIGNWYLVVHKPNGTISRKDLVVNFLFYDSDNLWLHKQGDFDSDQDNVTHWMPLPKPPKNKL